MKNNRIELQEQLEQILGSRNVYFQPPESIKMKYPAIVYSLDDIQGRYANDGVYFFNRRYQLILIDAKPDSPIINKLLTLKHCRFSRNYVSDNLNHTVFTLYF